MGKEYRFFRGKQTSVGDIRHRDIGAHSQQRLLAKTMF
jgi:hypothetical protein